MSLIGPPPTPKFGRIFLSVGASGDGPMPVECEYSSKLSSANGSFPVFPVTLPAWASICYEMMFNIGKNR
jgi:hypothetical protein